MGHSGDQQMLVLGDLTRVAWHGKEAGRSQMIGLDPKTEAEKKKGEKLVVGQGSWRTELKPRTPGKRKARKRRKILHRNPSK